MFRFCGIITVHTRIGVYCHRYGDDNSGVLWLLFSARENKENLDDLEAQNVLVGSDGSMFWWTSIGQSMSHCRIDIAWFPLDIQRCSLTFESWTMNSEEMNMTAMDPSVDLRYYKRSGEWDLIGEYNTVQLAYCAEKNILKNIRPTSVLDRLYINSNSLWR